MTFSPISESNTLYLTPNNHDVETIKHYINIASNLEHNRLKSLTFIYLMDIRHVNPEFGSLIFDANGHIFKSAWSTSRLSNELFNHYGFNYDSWSEFLKKTYNRPRTIFPFVKNNHIFIRITENRRKHSSWVNLTLLKGMKTKTSHRHAQHLDSMNLAFKPTITEDSHFQKLELFFNRKTSKLISQIDYAYQLTNKWYDFNLNIENDKLFREKNPVSQYLSNPAFDLFIKDGIPFRGQFNEQLKLNQFMQYNNVRNLLTHTDKKSPEYLRSMMISRRLYHELFKNG